MVKKRHLNFLKYFGLLKKDSMIKNIINYTLCIGWIGVIIITQCVIYEGGHVIMDSSKKIKELRERTGMNRKEFCEYFDIPYRTVTEWERDNRHAPEYVLRLLEYYIRMEKLVKDKEAEKTDEG